MEYVGQQNIKRLCNFYVSNIHLSVMLLPYLSKQIDEDVEITTIFEDLKKQDIEDLLNKLNVKNKNEILSMNWFNSNRDDYDNILSAIKEGIKDNKKTTIIIGGNKKYISENNKRIQDILNNQKINSDIKIIDCYNIYETEKEMREIIQKYDGIINTSGEIKVTEII